MSEARYPSYCCQKCGQCIGWIGRALQATLGRFYPHQCEATESGIGQPFGAEDGENFVVGYMCLVDYECELGCAAGGNVVYPSLADIRESRRCVTSCGVVEVEVRARRIVQPAADPTPTISNTEEAA